MTTTGSAVAVVGQEDEQIRPLPVLPTAQRLAMALPSLDELKVLEVYGEMFAKSGLFPNVKTWQAAAAIIQYGAQLGIDAFTALKDIYWINGKPTCDASLINALIKRDHGGDALMPVEATAERCTIRFKRREWDHYEEATITADDYKYLINDKTRVPWQNNRADMLWARNVSQIGRRHYGDTIKGLYDRQEMLDAQATEASFRVVHRPTAAAGEDATDVSTPDGAEVFSGAFDPEVPAGRTAEANALGNAVAGAYATDKARARDIGAELIRTRFGIAETRQATAEHLREVREAVERWQGMNWADGGLKALRIVAEATTESMALDTKIVFEEQGIDDPFVVAALDRVLAGYDAERERQDAARNRVMDAAMVP